MSVVNITNIQVLDNPTRLGNPFQFEITFECIAPLQNGTVDNYMAHQYAYITHRV